MTGSDELIDISSLYSENCKYSTNRVDRQTNHTWSSIPNNWRYAEVGRLAFQGQAKLGFSPCPPPERCV